MGRVVAFYKHDPFADDVGLVKKRLIERFGYGHERYRLLLDTIVADIRSLVPELREHFLHYWNTAAIDPTVSVSGFTLEELVCRANYTPLAALLLLSELVKNPEATEAIILHRIDCIENPNPLVDFSTGRGAPPPQQKLPGWE
jgi:hypothetical protein